MKDAKLEALKETSLFADFSKKHLELIGQVTDRVRLDAGRVLIREGTVPNEMAILVSGKAVVEAGGQTLAQLGPGDVVGELALVDNQRASATVTITDDAEVWLVGHAGFKPIWEKNPDISTELLRAVVGRLRATNELLT